MEYMERMRVGYNIDLIKMFGSFKVECPYCGHVESAEKYGFDDVDVDCTDYNPAPGVWVIHTHCFWGCEKGFNTILHVKIDHVSTEKREDAG